MSRGRPARLPFESSSWIAYATALKSTAERFQSTRLAIAKLNRAFQDSAVRCKIESVGKPPELLAASARISVYITATDAEVNEVVAATGRWPDDEVVIDTEELSAGWEQRLEISVSAWPITRDGWLFIWEPDFLKYFGITAEPVKATEAKGHESRITTGRPVVHEWRKMTLIAARLHREFQKDTRNAIVRKLQDCIAGEGINPPADSELQKMVAQVFAFDEWCPPKHRTFQKGR
jgi:hypothetical protein